jgi:hypothetical protein
MHAYSNDFTFLVGTSSYCCPSFVADFLSPHISKLRSVDPTIHEFVIETADPHDDFLSFLALGAGYTVLVNFNNATFFGSLCRELANVVILQLISHSSHESLNCRTVIDQLLLLCELCGNCETEVAFCASHFHELPSSSLSKLSLPILSTILSHQSLKLKSEDSLYEFIFHQLERSWEYSA